MAKLLPKDHNNEHLPCLKYRASLSFVEGIDATDCHGNIDIYVYGVVVYDVFYVTIW